MTFGIRLHYLCRGERMKGWWPGHYWLQHRRHPSPPTVLQSHPPSIHKNMKHCILLLLLSLSSLLGAQGINWPSYPLPTPEDTTDILVVTGWDSLGRIILEWQSPASTTGMVSDDSPTEADIVDDFRIEYSGGGIVSDKSLTWEAGPINTWEPYTSRLHLGSLITEYYPLIIDDFLRVKEVVDSVGVSYHFQCQERVSDIIAETCYALRNVPFLLSCDYPGMTTLRLRFSSTISIEWARELATGAAMTYFYPVWVSRK